MAEAMVVEERSTVPKRYFCHMCNVEINIPNTDYTCPLCSNGFVEELSANDPDLTASTSNPDAANASTSTGNNSGGSGVSGVPSGASNALLNLHSLRNDLVSLLSMRNVPNLEITIEPNRRHTSVMNVDDPLSSGGTSTTSGIAGGRVRPANLDRLDNVLYDFLQSLPLAGATAEIVTGPGGGGSGNSHMFFMGNPGDYAWGREGLDTIVTQMLNQMETLGPPPLSAQRINEIPNVKISAEEVERKLQCSVCWDDFKLDETVRKLPCSHLYHENCIVPWLNLHSTCPICRKSLANSEDVLEDGDVDDYVLLNNFGDENGSGGSGSGSNNTLTSTVANNASSQTATQSDSTSPTTAAGGAAQPTTRNNVFTFDDDNMFLD